MRINLNFTPKGKIAILNFTNEELLEIFTRYTNTLTKKYVLDITFPPEANADILGDASVTVVLDNVKCDVDLFFKLGRDIKIPLKKRLDGNLDNVFKMVKVE